LKECSKCHEIKDLNEFSPYKKSKDGKFSWCKECMRKASRKYSKEHKQERTLYHREYLNRMPWRKHYQKAKERCEYLKNNRFNMYGARGIKFLMTLEDFKFLWERDRAERMQKPSIDRIDNDGNYTLKNCRFIEKVFNTRGKAK